MVELLMEEVLLVSGKRGTLPMGKGWSRRSTAKEPQKSLLLLGILGWEFSAGSF
jgi:hypothetical protein